MIDKKKNFIFYKTINIFFKFFEYIFSLSLFKIQSIQIRIVLAYHKNQS